MNKNLALRKIFKNHKVKKIKNKILRQRKTNFKNKKK